MVFWYAALHHCTSGLLQQTLRRDKWHWSLNLSTLLWRCWFVVLSLDWWTPLAEPKADSTVFGAIGGKVVEKWKGTFLCPDVRCASLCQFAIWQAGNSKIEKKSHIMEERYCCRKFRLFSNCLDGVLRLKISCWSYPQQWDPLGSQCDFKLKSEFFGFPSKVDFFFHGFHRPMILRHSETLEDDF